MRLTDLTPEQLSRSYFAGEDRRAGVGQTVLTPEVGDIILVTEIPAYHGEGNPGQVPFLAKVTAVERGPLRRGTATFEPLNDAEAETLSPMCRRYIGRESWYFSWKYPVFRSWTDRETAGSGWGEPYSGVTHRYPPLNTNVLMVSAPMPNAAPAMSLLKQQLAGTIVHLVDSHSPSCPTIRMPSASPSWFLLWAPEEALPEATVVEEVVTEVATELKEEAPVRYHMSERPVKAGDIIQRWDGGQHMRAYSDARDIAGYSYAVNLLPVNVQPAHMVDNNEFSYGNCEYWLVREGEAPTYTADDWRPFTVEIPEVGQVVTLMSDAQQRALRVTEELGHYVQVEDGLTPNGETFGLAYWWRPVTEHQSVLDPLPETDSHAYKARVLRIIQVAVARNFISQPNGEALINDANLRTLDDTSIEDVKARLLATMIQLRSENSWCSETFRWLALVGIDVDEDDYEEDEDEPETNDIRFTFTFTVTVDVDDVNEDDESDTVDLISQYFSVGNSSYGINDWEVSDSTWNVR